MTNLSNHSFLSIVWSVLIKKNMQLLISIQNEYAIILFKVASSKSQHISLVDHSYIEGVSK